MSKILPFWIVECAGIRQMIDLPGFKIHLCCYEGLLKVCGLFRVLSKQVIVRQVSLYKKIPKRQYKDDIKKMGFLKEGKGILIINDICSSMEHYK